ncbi:MAG: BamA/TamA family outer membrane protein [FCB group bacterium]|nr:BamA/TamA family outer membrane protein [FCB group bacterium]
MSKFIFTLIISAGLFAGTQDHFSQKSENANEITNRNVIKILHDYTIPAGETVNKDLKIIGGDLTVGGTVNGEITIIGGDVELLATAIINGRLIVLGGELHQNPMAEVNGHTVEFNENSWSISRENEKEISTEPEEPEEAVYTTRSSPYSDDGWLRYNRQEGFFLQANLYLQSSYIKGATLYGGVGRAFNRNRYYGVLGLEQLFNNRQFEFYIEGYSRAATDDLWRMSDGENSLAAFFLHEDFLDWYYTEGFTAGAVYRLPNLFTFKAGYTDEKQSFMNTVVSWSMFGGNKEFRDGYEIDEGRDIRVEYELAVGKQYQWKSNDLASIFFNYHHSNTTGTSDFDYTKDEFILDTYIPFDVGMGFHFGSRYGGITGDYFGSQHQFYIGGIGSLRGFGWKEFTGSHYLLASAEIIFEHCSVFYERGTTWNYEDSTIDKDFIKKFQGFTGREAAGISFGDKDVKLDIITQVGKHRQSGITVNLILNDI